MSSAALVLVFLVAAAGAAVFHAMRAASGAGTAKDKRRAIGAGGLALVLAVVFLVVPSRAPSAGREAHVPGAPGSVSVTVVSPSGGEVGPLVTPIERAIRLAAAPGYEPENSTIRLGLGSTFVPESTFAAEYRVVSLAERGGGAAPPATQERVDLGRLAHELTEAFRGRRIADDLEVYVTYTPPSGASVRWIQLVRDGDALRFAEEVLP
ncbi:MAG: hypothetical protein R3F34_06715 [Planctomycetota bacterium]